jgi:hypothetical protein
MKRRNHKSVPLAAEILEDRRSTRVSRPAPSAVALDNP